MVQMQKEYKVLNAPPLGMMNDWYLISQLKNFQHGIRGFDPVLDPNGCINGRNGSNFKNRASYERCC